VVRGIFGHRREEVAGEWRRLHNEELRNLYVSLDITKVIKSRRMRWAENVVCMGKMLNACNILVGKLKGKRPRGRSRRGWKGNIRMDFGEIGLEVDWMYVAWARDLWRDLVNTVMNLRVS
jgi:hypothetical protein